MRLSNSRPKLKVVLPLFIAACLAFTVGTIVWHKMKTEKSAISPLNSKAVSSLEFPTYYPSRVPIGFRIDKKSISVQHKAILDFDFTTTKSGKIYISEEAKPSAFNFSAYYKKFAGLELTNTTNGTLATGKIDAGHVEVGSIVNDHTWILASTNSSISISQIKTMLESLVVNQ